MTLVETSDVLRGRVHEERSTLSGVNDAIVTLNQLARNVLPALFSGIGGRLTRRAMMELQVRDIEIRGFEFFEDLAKARPELTEFPPTVEGVAALRDKSPLLASPTMLRVLADVWRVLTTEEGAPREEVVKFFAGLPMKPAARNLWTTAGFVHQTETGWSTPLARTQDMRRAVSAAVSAFKAQKAKS
jgi:hypothetical protein